MSSEAECLYDESESVAKKERLKVTQYERTQKNILKLSLLNLVMKMLTELRSLCDHLGKKSMSCCKCVLSISIQVANRIYSIIDLCIVKTREKNLVILQ